MTQAMPPTPPVRTARNHARAPASVIASALLLIVMVLIAMLGPWLAPHDPFQIHQHAINQASSGTFWLGTDEFGRDILSRLLYGIRPTILVATGATLLATLLGCAMGIAGKSAIEIAVVQRRATASRHDRRCIGKRNNRDAATHVGGRQQPSQSRQRDLAFILVAVIAGHEQQAWAVAVAHANQGNLYLKIRRTIDRERNRQIVHRLAVGIQVKVVKNAGMHGAASTEKGGHEGPPQWVRRWRLP